ncbi:hypothetical protein B0T14DRAFT_135912 [Immersiella caudata]|uniref:Fungal N-terminal domain-containing protein n=1 Tax=Immersiella caudata TaxID=314043 RepID=A0AA39X583_9PEZI|nr:hypothetical protein B0T14DRAFT_135912 [Immersiella caudata]
MEPFSALAIATGVITFVDFGSKLVLLFLQAQSSDDGRPAALSALETELRQLSNNASRARETCASLQTRYPDQLEPLSQLAAECSQAEHELQRLADTLTAKPGQGLRARGSLAFVSVRGVVKKHELDALQSKLRNIRERTTMSVIMCLLEDAKETRRKLDTVDGGVKETLDTVRRLRKAVHSLQPEFESISRSRPMATDTERGRVAEGLWTSITATSHYASLEPLEPSVPTSDEDRYASKRVLATLNFDDINARENQIQTPFPETFSWIFQQRPSREDSPSESVSTGLKEWLGSQVNDTPFWITGKPPSLARPSSKLLSSARFGVNFAKTLLVCEGDMPRLPPRIR